MAADVLKQLCPVEAEIVKDPALQAIVRFR